MDGIFLGAFLGGLRAFKDGTDRSAEQTPRQSQGWRLNLRKKKKKKETVTRQLLGAQTVRILQKMIWFDLQSRQNESESYAHNVS